jgi:hypothetical protein
MYLSLRRIKILGRFPFVRIIQVLDNPRFIFHILKKNIFYKRESQNYSSRYSSYKFLNGEESLQHIIDHKVSMARFSDGEIGILMGAGIYPPDSNWSQKWSKELQYALSNVLKSSSDNLFIAVDPPCVFLASKNSKHPIPFEWNMWIDTKRNLFKFLNAGQKYGHCHLFLPENSPEFNWKKFKSYLTERNVIVCTGNIESISHLNLGITTDFIECGANNAFEKKEVVKSNIYKCIKDNDYSRNSVIIMLCLGPTACILASEMVDLQVLDTGHMFEFAAKGFLEVKLSS